MSEQLVQVGQIELCYETFGPDDAPPLLLVMGLGSQMIVWDDHFCRALADRGARVIRFDNRDTGRSTIISDVRPPTLRQLALRDKRGAAYSLDELAADAVGLLDVLGVERADIVGASMGGMIVQLIAIDHATRVRSLTSIMSTTGNWRVGWPHPKMAMKVVRRARTDREGYIADFVDTMHAIGSDRNPTPVADLRELAARSYERGVHPAGTSRQLGAIQTAPDRTARLARLSLPACVIHGRQDPLIHRTGGAATAKAIPGAKLLMLDGMGHAMPRALQPQMVDAIAATIAVAAGR